MISKRLSLLTTLVTRTGAVGGGGEAERAGKNGEGGFSHGRAASSALIFPPSKAPSRSFFLRTLCSLLSLSCSLSLHTTVYDTRIPSVAALQREVQAVDI